MEQPPMTTMQTPEPLRRTALNSGQESVEQIIRLPNLVLDPPYQRGSVWGTRRRINLLRSLLLGIPVGSIFLNVRPDDEMTTVVVDGKQRIETIRDFYANAFAIPASWFRPEEIVTTEDTADGPYVRYEGLTETGRRRIWRCSITTQRTDLRTVAEEAALFDLINFGGVPQGDSDLD
jgi:hypothetical protein